MQPNKTHDLLDDVGAEIDDAEAAAESALLDALFAKRTRGGIRAIREQAVAEINAAYDKASANPARCHDAFFDPSDCPHEIVRLIIEKDLSLPAAWRVHKGCTHADVAAITDVGIRTIQRFENGKSTPNVRSLMKLAQLYGCLVEQLVDVDE